MELEGKTGFADGIRADTDGNIWASAGWVGDGYDGVHIFAPNGDRHRLDQASGDLLQRLLWGNQAQPAVHDRESVPVRGLRGDPGSPSDLKVMAFPTSAAFATHTPGGTRGLISLNPRPRSCFRGP